MLVAYWRDIEGWDYDRIIEVSMAAGVNRASRGTAERYCTEGRRLLWEEGVWPWMVRAEMPSRATRWWDDHLYRAVISEWCIAVLRAQAPMCSPRSGPRSSVPVLSEIAVGAGETLMQAYNRASTERLGLDGPQRP
jgi:hypothetical protein